MVRNRGVVALRFLYGVMLLVVFIGAGALIYGCSSSNKPSVFQDFEEDGTYRGFINYTGQASQPTDGWVSIRNTAGQIYSGRIVDGTDPSVPVHPLGLVSAAYSYFEIDAPPADYDVFYSIAATPLVSAGNADEMELLGFEDASVRLWAEETVTVLLTLSWPLP